MSSRPQYLTELGTEGAEIDRAEVAAHLTRSPVGPGDKRRLRVEAEVREVVAPGLLFRVRGRRRRRTDLERLAEHRATVTRDSRPDRIRRALVRRARRRVLVLAGRP